jgi:hypothetical protein
MGVASAGATLGWRRYTGAAASRCSARMGADLTEGFSEDSSIKISLIPGVSLVPWRGASGPMWARLDPLEFNVLSA